MRTLESILDTGDILTGVESYFTDIDNAVETIRATTVNNRPYMAMAVYEIDKDLYYKFKKKDVDLALLKYWVEKSHVLWARVTEYDPRAPYFFVMGPGEPEYDKAQKIAKDIQWGNDWFHELYFDGNISGNPYYEKVIRRYLSSRRVDSQLKKLNKIRDLFDI